MSCRKLAERYVRDFPLRPIPEASAPVNPDRAAWLLEQKWCCLVDTQGTVSCDPAVCARNAPSTILRESGFLAWVNERSLQCINKVTGQINLTPHKEPGLVNGLQPSYCIEECYHATPDSKGCFACVKQVLENPASRLVIDDQQPCPALFDPALGLVSVDTDLIEESMRCQDCIASNSANLVMSEPITDQQGNTTFSHEYNTRAFENIWACVTGRFKLDFAPTRVVILGLMLLCIIAALVIEIRIFRRRHQKNAKSDQIKPSFLFKKNRNKLTPFR